MSQEDEDRLIFRTILSTPECRQDYERVKQLLIDDIQRSRFHRERAENLFLSMIDNCIRRYSMRVGGEAGMLVPKEIRYTLANEYAEIFIRSRGDIGSNRPARRGLLAFIMGKWNAFTH